MKLYGKAKQVAQEILEAFEAGKVPAALAQVFIHRNVDCPAKDWSWRNRLLVALRGHADARGFRQWQAVGRQVKKGERALYILAPRTVKAKEDDEEKGIQAGDSRVVGFAAVAVFGKEQTSGEPLAYELEDQRFLNQLPLVEVARFWGLDVSLFNGSGGQRLGFYRHGERIGLGVKNLATWAHELVHAADDRRGTLTRRAGQQLDNEVVAELGGAVLLESLGLTVESDRGGAFRYIQGYCEHHETDLLSTCTDLLERTCSAVELILDTAAVLEEGEAEQVAKA